MTQANSAADDRWMFAIPAGLALLMVLLGVMLIALARYGDARAASMRSWPSTTGTVTASGPREQRQQDGYWNHYDETGVRYEVAGRSYAFTESVYVGRSQSSGLGDAHALSHHANDSVRVFYDPADPSHGSTTNDPESPSTLLTLLGALFFALSLPLWYLSARWFLKRRRSTAVATS